MERVKREGQDWNVFPVILGRKGGWIGSGWGLAETLKASSAVGSTANLVGERGELESAAVTGGSVSPPQAELCPGVSGSCLVGVGSLLPVERPHGVPLAPSEASLPQGGLELKCSFQRAFILFPKGTKNR